MPDVSRNTYESFVAEYYDAIPFVKDRADLMFYLDEAKRSGDPIVELGCGTGRVLLPIAEAGHRVCGLDLSPHMLKKCREKLRRLSPEVRNRVRLVEADMIQFELGEKFRLISIPFRPFQHLLSVEEQISCLRAAHRHLEPGGRLILDVFQADLKRLHDPFFLEESKQPWEFTLPDGRCIRLTDRIVAFHRAAQVNDVEQIFYVTHPDGRAERFVHAFRMRYFFRYEVEHLLARCGFRVVELFGDYDRSPLRDDSPEMLFLAELPAV
ncbi:MAG: class I SAM-dependent methyltransferase [Candidatus Acidiferrales bacterium]